ncbi:MAG TPA: tRNA guanosine(34) transglycosylase Tgt [Candidatus Paceibacterota bacterium]|nr:tRNA guanosine(34) transglycosylase Tgt [Candidatus Paceibacterota bacterium]
MRPVNLKIDKQLPGGARAGILSTPHGDIQTPAFTVVATKATSKGVDQANWPKLGVQVVIANTYHLYLSPGEDLVAKAGGVHKFMNWQGPVMTDSGGFQVFSLGSAFGKKVSKFSSEEPQDPSGGRDEHDPNSPQKNLAAPALYDEDLATSHGKLAIVDDEGVSFTSHVDGTLHRFTPERSVEIQHKLGGDIFFAFDECTAPVEPYEYQKEAADRTARWAKRSLTTHRQNIEANQKQAIYGIGQGGQFDDLRRQSAQEIGNMGFDGFGLGGSFASKYGPNSLQSALDVLKELPSGMPVHGLGVGEPEDLFLGAAYGVDTFDCVLPTRNGRTGGVYAKMGKYQVTTAAYREDFGPLDDGCECPTCTSYTRAYVHHLFRTKEMLGLILASQHNIYFLTNLTKKIRESILNGNFNEFRDTFLAQYQHGNI